MPPEEEEEIQAAQKKLSPAVYGRESLRVGWGIYVIADARRFIINCCSLVHLALRADAEMEMAAAAAVPG